MIERISQGNVNPKIEVGVSKLNSPELSIVIVVPDSYNTIRRTIQHLCTQTVQDCIELVMVAPLTKIPDFDASDMEGFFGYQIIEVGNMPSIDRVRAAGIRQAQAPLVALIEDHVYPTANWAEVLITAYHGPWSAVGTVIANANPQSMLSWATFLLGYNTWAGPIESSEIDDLPRHNPTYRRDVLMAYDAILEDMLEMDSDFHQILRDDGHRFYLAANAKLAHLNPSLLPPVMKMHFILGRLYGATRARREHWSLFRRLLYIGGAPLIPVVRLSRVLAGFFETGERNDLFPHILPSLFINLVMDAVGQAVGYAFDRGKSLQQYQEFEINRLRHVNRQDRRAFTP